MERKDVNTTNERDLINKEREEASQNPFKETGMPEPAETPEEEAAAEQQRKEALTERD